MKKQFLFNCFPKQFSKTNLKIILKNKTIKKKFYLAIIFIFNFAHSPLAMAIQVRLLKKINNIFHLFIKLQLLKMRTKNLFI